MKFGSNQFESINGTAAFVPPIATTQQSIDFSSVHYNNVARVDMEFNGTIADVTNVGATTVNVYKNGGLVTIGESFVVGDLLKIETFPRALSGVTASVVFDVDSGAAFMAPNGWFPLNDWNHIRNGSIVEDSIPIDNQQSQIISYLQGSLNTGINRLDATSQRSFSGSGWIAHPLNAYAREWHCGLQDSANPTIGGINYAVIRHAIYQGPTITQLRVRELGVDKGFKNFATSGANPIDPFRCFGRVYDSGSDIQYQYTLDAGATWTTFITSALPYTPNTRWYATLAAPQRIERVGPVYLYSNNILE